ncbi:hypothetical protein [Streptacidiphilus rugosus]|uniref:hypothetical protein n=1 Tax=Streptacidiphilus rugosus TaxID=405783 RepID=UPI0012F783DB|nr:hypothetical protein [Streptacidiphilus rugosus]
MGTFKRSTRTTRVVVGTVLAAIAVAAGYGFGFAFDHLDRPGPSSTGGLQRSPADARVTPANTWDMQ